jgi:uncharacterized protein HemX
MRYDIWILIEAMLIVFGIAALGYFFFRRQRLQLEHEYAKAQRLQTQVEKLQQQLSSRRRQSTAPVAAPNRDELARLRSDVDRARTQLHQMQDGIGDNPATEQQEQAAAMIDQLDRQLQATQDVLDRALHATPDRKRLH